MSFEKRILRGGSWIDTPQACRSAYRSRLRPAFSDNSVGFRVCCLSLSPTNSLMSEIRRILRGGSWFSTPQDCRSAFRSRKRPANSDIIVGFRVVCHRPQSFINFLMSEIRRILRGGSWFNEPQACRSAYRSRLRPAFSDNDVGFRVCCLSLSPTNSLMSEIRRILRGGSWFSTPQDCRSAYRGGLLPALSISGVGFRVCCLPLSPINFLMSEILRLLRGGSLIDAPRYCRSAYRNRKHPAYSNDLVGFRVVCHRPQSFINFLMSEIRRILRGGSWIDAPHNCRSAYRNGLPRVYSNSLVGFRVTSVNLAMDMLLIPAGNFLMGSLPSEEGHYSDELPQHKVTVDSFYMSKYPITQAQWEQVMGNNPSYYKDKKHPVENVTWYDAMEFCRRLSEATGQIYTLPTEAQWEYACRAGTTTPFSFGDTINTDQANYDGTYTYGNGSRGVYRQKTTPVDQFPPNPWGLHDMHGNVWEWCQDEWRPSYEGAPSDGSAREACKAGDKS